MLSLPSRGAWIETFHRSLWVSSVSSLPSRGAWIETLDAPRLARFAKVAPLTGSVD